LTPAFQFGVGPLSVAEIARLSQAPLDAAFHPDSLTRMQRGRDIVEQVLSSGAAIYGTTTGIGSQKEAHVGGAELAAFSDRMIVSEATLAPGEDFPVSIVRGALLLLCHNFARGTSGVSLELADGLLEMLRGAALPRVRRDTAFGAADLTPMAQLALPLIGRRRVAADLMRPAASVLKPKESLSLIDNNCFSLAEAAHVLHESRLLLNAFDAAAALACEGFRAGLVPHTEAAGGGVRSAGQTRARRNLFALLEGSALHAPGAARFLQDPLSFRSITQVQGAAYESLDWATLQVETEINTATDNPLVDFATQTLQPSASMMSFLPPLALDMLRQALAKVAVTSHERGLKLQSPPFSGLPVGLTAPGAADGGVLSINLHYIGAARLGTLSAAAAPVLLTYIGHMADGVEDVATLLPLSVTQTRTVLERAWELAVLEMIVGVWAIHRRALPLQSLGKGVRLLVERLLPQLHVGEEGVRLFDLAAIVEDVRGTPLIACAFAAAAA
jgi:histidine ammonia-lyase